MLLLLAFPVLAPVEARAADAVELPVLPSSVAADGRCTSASPRTAEAVPWTVAALGLDRGQRLSRGRGVTVAVVDTGVGVVVPSLKGRVRSLGAGGGSGDCVGHGTFAAGLIAGSPTEGAGPVGVAPEAEIVSVRAGNRQGQVTPGQLADAIREAADSGAGVVYVASALRTGERVLTDAVAHATGRDALVVAPAAPDSLAQDASGDPLPDVPWYWPASAPGVLSVLDYGPGGTRPEGAPTVAGADLAAPGDLVVGPGPVGRGHYIGSGSSLAAAHTAGAAALLRARHPELDAGEVARRLVSTAYPDTVPRLDPYAALTALPPSAAGKAPGPEAARAYRPPSSVPRDRSVLIALGAGCLVLLAGAAAVVVPRGRARGWRPGGAG